MENAHGHYSCRWQGRSKVVLKQQSSRTPGAPSEIYKNFQLQTEKYYRNQREGDRYFLFRKSELTIAEKPAADSICAN